MSQKYVPYQKRSRCLSSETAPRQCSGQKPWQAGCPSPSTLACIKPPSELLPRTISFCQTWTCPIAAVGAQLCIEMTSQMSCSSAQTILEREANSIWQQEMVMKVSWRWSGCCTPDWPLCLSFFIKMVFGTHLSKAEGLQISYSSFFRKPVSTSDKINVEKRPICSDTGCTAGTEHRAERQCRQAEECSKAAEPRRGQGIRLSVWQHFLCKIGDKKISVFFWLWWKHDTHSSLVQPGHLRSYGEPTRDSQSLLSFTVTFHQHMSAYARLPLSLRCEMGFAVLAPEDTGWSKAWTPSP